MSIRFESITKTFDPENVSKKKTVLNQISFEALPGKILFILGKSGSGKSVILKHIMGILQADSGTIWIDQKPLTQKNIASIRKKCGMVFQQPALFDFLSIYENISFGMRQKPKEKEEALAEDKIADQVLENVTLVHLNPEILGLYPHELSYGMQKQVSIARALMNQPNYLLFDEPTTGLDPISSRMIYDLIYQLSKKLKTTSIIVSHDIHYALQCADHILFLDEGRILIHSNVFEFKNCQYPMIQDFLKEDFDPFSQEEKTS